MIMVAVMGTVTADDKKTGRRVAVLVSGCQPMESKSWLSLLPSLVTAVSSLDRLYHLTPGDSDGMTLVTEVDGT